MGKLIFWAVLILGGLLVGRILAHYQHQARQRPPAARRPAAAAPAKDTEAMVRCAHCGIHLPRSEALLSRGKTWCSEDHARLGPGKHDA